MENVRQLEARPNQWDMSLIQLPKWPATDVKSKLAVPLNQAQVAERLIYPDPRPFIIDTFNVPSNCPPGLEPLWASNASLIVLRRPENAIHLIPEQRLMAFAQYDIVNDKGRQLYVAVEQTSRKSLYWIRDARMFDIAMYDRQGEKILTIKRPWTCKFCCAQYYCCCCMFGFQGCGNDAIITLCNGNKKLGSIKQSFSIDRTVLEINDEHNRHCLTIAGSLQDGILDVFLTTDGDDDPIAMIEGLMTPQEVSAFYKIKISSYEDPYGITFFTKRVPTKHKALIVAGVILMDYILCKPNTDYPHWTQFIPPDYKLEAETREKLFRDGSKEIIVTSMKPRNSRRNSIRERRRCGCCRWFFAFICLCCPLGFSRNALRCIQLIVFGIVLFVIACLLIAFV